jgi:hypothetical protein
MFSLKKLEMVAGLGIVWSGPIPRALDDPPIFRNST